MLLPHLLEQQVGAAKTAFWHVTWAKFVELPVVFNNVQTCIVPFSAYIATVSCSTKMAETVLQFIHDRKSELHTAL